MDLGPWVTQILAHCFLRCDATLAAKAQTSYKDSIYLLNRVINFQSNKNVHAHLYVWQVRNRAEEPEQKLCILSELQQKNDQYSGVVFFGEDFLLRWREEIKHWVSAVEV